MSEERNGRARALRRFCRTHRLAAISAGVIALALLLAAAAPLLTPYGFDEIVTDAARLAPPSLRHPLGTDEVGRDVWTRLLYGARVSLFVGIVPTALSMLLGAALGILAGYLGGWVESIIMRAADIMLAFPSMLLAMVLMYTLGDGIGNIVLALALVSWASVARIVRAETLRLRACDYVEAARAIGVRSAAIMWRHILPNCIPSLTVLFTLNIPAAILAESSLSFLGLGIQKPAASWGLMVNAGRQYLYTNAVLSLAPGTAIMVIVLAFHFLGDGLRDALDPQKEQQ